MSTMHRYLWTEEGGYRMGLKMKSSECPDCRGFWSLENLNDGGYVIEGLSTQWPLLRTNA